VLVALSPSERAFLPYDTELLSTYAAQAAIAVGNARLYEAQQALASRDPLTGLLNHREFHEAVSRELERCRRHGRTLSVVVFDLDGFKLVNDVSGHAEGDRVLRGAAQALEATARAGDLACRIGGDELALVLPETACDEARRVADRVRAAVGAVDARTGASYGVASWPQDGPTKDTLLQRADADLYAMKRGRRAVRAASEARAARTPAQRDRLATASRLSALLAPLADAQEIAEVTVGELHRSFGFYVAGLQRLDEDGVLRLVSARGELTNRVPDLVEAWTQTVDQGVSGRAVRLGEPVLVADTREDPDFVTPPEQSAARSALTVPVRVAGEVWGVLDLEALEPNAFDADDLLLGVMVAAQVGAALHRCVLAEEREQTFMTTLGVLSDALESKDSYTAAHAREVAELCEAVAERLALSGEPRRALRYAALLHDIGKIGVRTEILTKPGALTAEEFEEIKRHTVIGAEMLGRIPGFEPVQALVRWAHERWDGSGYPDGLAGESIPMAARIICACDAYHAMTSDRPYRRALPAQAAIAELRRCAGTHFDPAVVEALVAELAPLARAA
jgi:diguanylate cyclase (GGDEF)-like protein/putative nucleotidyltransferase with HDIG domain